MHDAHTLAQHILQLIGSGKFLLVGQPISLAIALNYRGCQADIVADKAGLEQAQPLSYDAILLPESIVHDGEKALVETLALAYGLTRRHLVVLASDITQMGTTGLTLGASNQQNWFDCAFRVGLRRGLCAERVEFYPLLGSPVMQPVTVFEKLPEQAANTWPLARILETRNLHMDMSRELGPRADAHIVRYALAAQWVRPGDVVLDCACGLGYGSATLASQSPAAKVIGVDIDEKAITYAKDNFAHQYGIQYECRSGTNLDFIPDQSVDFISSFETIEHIPGDYEAILREFKRVLKPGGRIIASVPHLWVDETGKDPNPYHYHAFDYDKFRDAMARHFIVERRYQQEAPGGFKLHQAHRNLAQVGLEESVNDTEWWILLAVNDPSSADGYQEPCLRATGQVHNRTRSQVLTQILARLEDLSKDEQINAIEDLTRIVIERSDAQLLADAVQIIQYQLERPQADARLHYHLGQLMRVAGDAALSTQAFETFLQNNHKGCCPQDLAAHFWLAMQDLNQADIKHAQTRLSMAIEQGQKAVADPSIGWQDKARISKLCEQFQAALDQLPLHEVRPQRFWAGVDLNLILHV